MLVDQDLWDASKSNTTQKDNSANSLAAPATPSKLGALVIYGNAQFMSNDYWKLFVVGTRQCYRGSWTLPRKGVRNIRSSETYYPYSKLALQIFLVCRQVYREASYIFYSKNRFFVSDIATLLAFLHDRPIPTRQYIHTLSIPVPYVRKLGKLHSYKRAEYTSTTSAFSKACTSMAKDWFRMLPNLKHLDLRIILDVPADVNQLKVRHMPAKELAKFASPEIMTVSLTSWCPRRDRARMIHRWNENSIFAPLPDDIFERIRHHHANYVNKSKATKEPKKEAKKENNEGGHSLLAPHNCECLKL